MMKAALEQYASDNPTSRIVHENDPANHEHTPHPQEISKPTKPGDYDAIKMRYPVI
jgi:hypothetical protein